MMMSEPELENFANFKEDMEDYSLSSKFMYPFWEKVYY